MTEKEQNINPWYFRQVFMAIFMLLALMLCYIGISQLFLFDTYPTAYIVTTQIIFYLFSFISVFYFAIYKKHNSMRQFLGTKDCLKQIIRGFFVFALIILTTTFIDRLSELLCGIESSDVYNGFDKWHLKFLAFIGIFFAPIAEEVFFRGFVQPVFVQRFGKIFGVIGVCLLFALLHVLYINNISALLGIISVGLILSITKEVTNSLIPCIVAHFLNNLLAVWIMFFT